MAYSNLPDTVLAQKGVLGRGCRGAAKTPYRSPLTRVLWRAEEINGILGIVLTRCRYRSVSGAPRACTRIPSGLSAVPHQRMAAWSVACGEMLGDIVIPVVGGPRWGVGSRTTTERMKGLETQVWALKNQRKVHTNACGNLNDIGGDMSQNHSFTTTRMNGG